MMPITRLFVGAAALAAIGCHGRHATGHDATEAGSSASTRALAVQLQVAAREDTPELDAVKRALGARGAEAVPEAVALCEDPDARVSEAAADVLEEVGSDDALDAVAVYASSWVENEKAWRRRRERLKRLATRSIAPLERRYRKATDVSERASILDAILPCGRSALPIVRLAVDDPDLRLQGQAEWMFGLLGGSEACPLLVERLRSDDVRLRIAAIAGLRASRDRGAVAHLIPILLAPDRDLHNNYHLPVNPTLHQEASAAIDELAGEPIGEDPVRARAWLLAHSPVRTSCPEPPSLTP